MALTESGAIVFRGIKMRFEMEKHSWMIEVIDDLAFYAVSNDLKQISTSLKEVKKTLLTAKPEPKSNVVRFETSAPFCKR